MRTVALIKRIIHQMIRDKRALALMMIAPLLIITLLHYLFSAEERTPTIGVIHGDSSFVEQLKENDIEIIQYDTNIKIEQTIIQDDLDGICK